MPLEIDESRFPLVVIDLLDELTDEDVQAFMDGGVRWISHGVPYGLVLVAKGLHLPGIAQLKPLIKWMNDNAEGLDRYHTVLAIVTKSPVVRGAVKTIFKLRTLYADQLVAEEREAAVKWADQRLKSLGKNADAG